MPRGEGVRCGAPLVLGVSMGHPIARAVYGAPHGQTVSPPPGAAAANRLRAGGAKAGCSAPLIGCGRGGAGLARGGRCGR